MVEQIKRPSRKKQLEESNPLPPQIPEGLKELERAIMLLGNRTKGELKPKVQKELHELIGTYPDEHQAPIWKMELRKIRKQRLSQKEA